MHMKKELKSQDDRRESGFERGSEETVSGEVSVRCWYILGATVKQGLSMVFPSILSMLQVSQLEMHIFP